MRCDHLVKDVVLMDGNRPEPPSRAPKVFAVGVDADGVLRKLSHQGAKPRNEGAIDIIGEQNQIGTLLQDRPDFFDGLWRKRDGERISGIYNEERLDLRIQEL